LFALPIPFDIIKTLFEAEDGVIEAVKFVSTKDVDDVDVFS
jgi:hypothetical protein